MTTEQEFQNILDKTPEDAHTRWVLADFLEERNDPRAPGYRELGRLQRYPNHFIRTVVAEINNIYSFYQPGEFYPQANFQTSQPIPEQHVLPYWWVKRIGRPYFHSRKECEDQAAQTYAIIHKLLYTPIYALEKRIINKSCGISFGRFSKYNFNYETTITKFQLAKTPKNLLRWNAIERYPHTYQNTYEHILSLTNDYKPFLAHIDATKKTAKIQTVTHYNVTQKQLNLLEIILPTP